MNALLLSLAKKEGILGIYLLAEVQPYAIKVANPKSSKAVLKVLTAMQNLDIDITGINETTQG